MPLAEPEPESPDPAGPLPATPTRALNLGHCDVGAVRIRLEGFLGTSDEEFEWAMQVNFFSTLGRRERRIVPMLKQDGGAIVTGTPPRTFFSEERCHSCALRHIAGSWRRPAWYSALLLEGTIEGCGTRAGERASALALTIGLTFALVAAASGASVLVPLAHGPTLLLVYWVGLAAVVAFASRLRAGRWLQQVSMRMSHPVLLGLVVGALCVVDFFMFRWNNSLKAVGRDATGDDAIIEAFRAFAAGLPMYSARLYDGAPISPGPVWVLLNGWLSMLQAHFLMTPFYLVAVLSLLERAWRAWFLLLLLLNPLVSVSSGIGHDHVTIGLAFLACWLWAERARPGAAHALGLTAAAVAVATSRVVYLGFPIFLALCATSMQRRTRWCVAGLGTALTVGAHAAFMVHGGSYQPAHLLNRGLTKVGLPLMIFGGAGALIVVAVGWRMAAARRTQPSSSAPPLGFALALLVPHVAIAFGEWVSVRGRMQVWEGAHYVLPAVPALAYALLRSCTASAASAAPMATSPS